MTAKRCMMGVAVLLLISTVLLSDGGSQAYDQGAYYQARCGLNHPAQWRGPCRANLNDNIAWLAAERDLQRHRRDQHGENRTGWVNRGCGG